MRSTKYYEEVFVIIKRVEVEGFWGTKKASAIFNQDVTIFIGLNGTGKSTFVNLIAATLSLDLIQLSILQFKSIRIDLIDRKPKRTKTIRLEKQISDENMGLDTYEYKVGQKVYRLFIESSRVVRRREPYWRIPAHIREEQLNLKKELSSLVEISQISVYRQSYDDSLESDPRQRISAVDERLRQLFEKFARYQLKLETRLNEISKRFQQDTVLSLLYNEKFDQFSPKATQLSKIDLKSLSEKLYQAFKELGIQGKNQDIDIHIQKIEDAIVGLKNENKNSGYQVDHVFALPLIYRTSHIINSLTESENEKNKITEARQNFFDTLHRFMDNKKFEYDNKTGELSFYIAQESNKKFMWTSLSSGEKQLLIQFLEVLLQDNRSVIFIADEPEISLHVTWQENLLKAIRSLNLEDHEFSSLKEQLINHKPSQHIKGHFFFSASLCFVNDEVNKVRSYCNKKKTSISQDNFYTMLFLACENSFSVCSDLQELRKKADQVAQKVVELLSNC
ncbi:AAA family ATPase [Planktothrix pseudagardhii]|uniref:Endonuclease GajA/Old nuclease/RecF-like AAA domain-containing protein n=1 Tax=Planktothrix pseudagardhii TaxID=132604 RepID=A0A9W4G831_9CYAN|nr:AAA family ATPase [Planktothrix pseudagardhii]CAD5957481.1 hypothetical protein NO713_02976 [Planktothrix pseudagardhii]